MNSPILATILWCAIGFIGFAIPTSFAFTYNSFRETVKQISYFDNILAFMVFMSAILGVFSFIPVCMFYFYIDSACAKRCADVGFIFPTKKYKEARLWKDLSQ